MLLELVFVALCGHVIHAGDDKPYTVEIDSYEKNTEYDEKFVNWDTLGMKRKGRNLFVVAGAFTLNRNLANEQKISIQIFNYNKDKQSKGPMIYQIEKEICKFISDDKDIYPGLKEKSNFPDPGTCPMPKNEYTIEDYEFNADFLPDSTPKGDYLLVVLLKDMANPVAGFNVIFTIMD